MTRLAHPHPYTGRWSILASRAGDRQTVTLGWCPVEDGPPSRGTIPRDGPTRGGYRLWYHADPRRDRWMSPARTRAWLRQHAALILAKAGSLPDACPKCGATHDRFGYRWSGDPHYRPADLSLQLLEHLLHICGRCEAEFRTACVDAR